MQLVKIPALDLRPGMFVAELDRPWLETPFMLQGFVVRDTDEVKYVADHVDHVYVDTQYGGHEMRLELAAMASPAAGSTIRSSFAADTQPAAAETDETGGKEKRLQLSEEFERSKLSFNSAAETLDQVFDSIRHGDNEDIEKVRRAIVPLIDGVCRNQEAVAALVRMKECIDYRCHHGVSMAVWAVMLGRQMGLPRDELEKLAVGCAMCDVGMTQLPPELLDQAGNLTDQQRAIVRAHPKIGAELVAQCGKVDFEILGIIENHHERFDGSGYPRGLEGAAIPPLARIAGLVDAYDAMITPRPYASARTSSEATRELLDGKGLQFQEALLEHFVKAIGLFPLATLVELNTGEVAIVVSQSARRRLKPEILLVTGKDKERLPTPRAVDLAEQCIARDGERWIARELLAGSYGIHSEEFFV